MADSVSAPREFHPSDVLPVPSSLPATFLSRSDYDGTGVSLYLFTCNRHIRSYPILIAKASKNNYGTRKLKIELAKSKDKIIVSRRKIGKIMAKYGLVSNYTIKKFKVHRSTCNEDNITNLVKREFDDRDELEVVVSDLTYVNVKGKWNYICILLDIYNREIIGFSAGKNKTASLVQKAFRTVKTNLPNISIFHTDRGNEFKNKLIDETLIAFGIKRSLSKKGCPYESLPHRV